MSYKAIITVTTPTIDDEMIQEAKEAYPDLPELEALKKLVQEEFSSGAEEEGLTVSTEIREVA